VRTIGVGIGIRIGIETDCDTGSDSDTDPEAQIERRRSLKPETTHPERLCRSGGPFVLFCHGEGERSILGVAIGIGIGI
jgi:hypothetical protein